MVEGSKFKESHVLENTKLWNKVGRMPRPLVLFRPSNSWLSFVLCLFPISCPWQIMPLRQPSQRDRKRKIKAINTQIIQEDI